MRTAVCLLMLAMAGCGSSSDDAPGDGATADAGVDAGPGEATLAVVVTGGGRVVSAPAGIDCGATCARTYPLGQVVMLTATPPDGAIFAGWDGAGCSGDAVTCTVTLDGDRTVTAIFEATFTAMVTKDGAGTGTVVSSPEGIDCGATCSHTFVPEVSNGEATPVYLDGRAAAGSDFLGVRDCTPPPMSRRCEVARTGTTSYVAVFATARTLTLRRTGTATGFSALVDGEYAAGGFSGLRLSGATATCTPDACTLSIADGASLTLTATWDAATATFTGWAGDCAARGTMPTCTLAMDRNHSVTASFNRVP